ncbi:MAG: hypothetical protein ABSC24_13815, partial [Verrucomicrobiota bacterium]
MSQAIKITVNVALLIFVIGFFTWLIVRTLRRTEDPAKMIFKWAVTIPSVIFGVWMARQMGPYGPFLIAFMGIVLSIMWTPHISEWISRPLSSLYDGGAEPPEPKPYYSIAQAKRQRREFLQAVVAIREQLARFPNDFEGVMLLAGIQAENLQDLPSAEITLNHFCDQPEPPPRQFAAAMNQLAD